MNCLFATPPSRRLQGGSALIMAITVLVIGGLLGAAMVRLLQTGEMSIALEVVSTRALHSAESGAQRKLNQVLVSTGAPACVAGDVWTPAATTALSDCTATVDCTSFVTTTAETFINLTSTGSCGSGEQTAVRVIEIQVRQ